MTGGQAVAQTPYDAQRRAQWRGKATAYQQSFALLCAHTAPMVLDALDIRPGSTLLDVGCGSGTVTEQATARGATVTAVDAEPSMAALTQRRVDRCRAVVGALPLLPLRDASFASVAANFVLNHVGRPRLAVRELVRVTADGGTIAVTIWPTPAPPLQELWSQVVEAARVTPPPPIALPADEEFERTAAGLAALLGNGGVVDVGTQIIEWHHRVEPDVWWHGAEQGIATIGQIVVAQDEATVRRLRASYDEIVAPLLDGDGMLVAATAAILAVGRPSR